MPNQKIYLEFYLTKRHILNTVYNYFRVKSFQNMPYNISKLPGENFRTELGYFLFGELYYNWKDKFYYDFQFSMGQNRFWWLLRNSFDNHTTLLYIMCLVNEL